MRFLTGSFLLEFTINVHSSPNSRSSDINYILSKKIKQKALFLDMVVTFFHETPPGEENLSLF